METNCYAYLISGTSPNQSRTVFISSFSTTNEQVEYTSSIWFSKFFLSKTSVTKAFEYIAMINHDFAWKIQKVTMNAPMDI